MERIFYYPVIYLGMSLLLVSCGNPTPAFEEKVVVPINLTVIPGDANAEVAAVPDLSSDEKDSIFASLDQDGVSADAIPESGDDGSSGSTGGGTTDTGSTSSGDNNLPVGGDSAAPAGGGSATPGGSTGGVVNNPSITTPSNAELKACAQLTGASVETIRIAGSKGLVNLVANSTIALKVTGNLNAVALTLDGNGNGDLGLNAVCIFAAGNQPDVRVYANVPVNAIVYTGRGNQSQGSINFSQYGFTRQWAIDLSGNESSLDITGDDACPNGRLKGNNTRISCH